MGRPIAVGRPDEFMRGQGGDGGDGRERPAAALRPGIEQGLRRDAGAEHVIERDIARAQLFAERAAGADQAIFRIEAGDGERQ